MSSLPVPIPDLRFDSSFRNTLRKEANARQVDQLLATSHLSELEIDELPDAPITTKVVVKVVLRDILLMPLFQGFLTAGFLLLAKPWLYRCVQNGRAYGVRLFKSLGFSVTPRGAAL